MKKILTFLPINVGKWVQTVVSDKWQGLAYMEQILDWSILPENCYGKLFVEMMNMSPEHVKEEGQLIELRLVYTQDPELYEPGTSDHGKEFVIEDSNISHKGSKRWQLKESEWFKLPRTHNVSCLWVQGKASGGAICGLALANLVIAQEI